MNPRTANAPLKWQQLQTKSELWVP